MSARNQTDNIFETSRWRASVANVANTFENLAVLIHLPQLALCLGFIAPMDHQIVDHQTNARPDTKSVLCE